MRKTILFIRDIFWFTCDLDQNENDDYQTHLFNWAIRYFLLVFLPFLTVGTYLLFKKILDLFNVNVPELNQYLILFFIVILLPYFAFFLIFKHFKKWLEKYPVNEKNNFESAVNQIFAFTIIVGSGFLLIISSIIFAKIGKLLDFIV